jgi:hypothetical protein
MNATKEHILHCLPDKYKRVTVEDWICPSDDHALKKGAALNILDDHYLQVWQGDTSRGKSMLAAGIAKRAAQTGVKTHYEATPAGLHALFKSETTKDIFGEWKTLPEHVRDLSRYDLLVIEDWNYFEMNSFQQEGWFTLLKTREESDKRTILITNNDNEAMKSAFSVLFDKIYRRIKERGCWIDFGQLPEWDQFKQPPLHTEKIGSPATKDQAVNQAMSMLSK